MWRTLDELPSNRRANGQRQITEKEPKEPRIKIEETKRKKKEKRKNLRK